MAIRRRRPRPGREGDARARCPHAVPGDGELRIDTPIFLPMAYYTFRTSGAAGVDRWIRRNITAIRRATNNHGEPIHIIGGLARDTTIPELGAFVDAVLARNAYVASLYEFEATTSRQWRVLQRLQ